MPFADAEVILEESALGSQLKGSRAHFFVGGAKATYTNERRLNFMSTDDIPTGNEDWGYRSEIIAIESGNDSGSQDD